MKIEQWTIKNHVVEYIDQTHTYLVDGVITPSVTQILKTIFPGKYEGVDQAVLNNASRKGTLLHGIIEEYENNGKTQRINKNLLKGGHLPAEFKNYIYLKNIFNFIPIQNEVPVIYEDSAGKVVFVGRLDMVALYEKQYIIVDIKRTYVLDPRYLRLQENLYRIAYQQSYGKQIDGLRALYLRNEARAFKKLEINEAEALNALEIYKRRVHEGNCKNYKY